LRSFNSIRSALGILYKIFAGSYIDAFLIACLLQAGRKLIVGQALASAQAGSWFILHLIG